ncbi:MAG: hypothetical protein AB1758_22630, partial [Candidatus Eremiobacterota bacterium]
AAADRLLGRHMELYGAAPRAARVMPEQSPGKPEPRTGLERALRSTSERILEGLAVYRASGGRRGLSLEQARAAQEQLGLLMELMADLAEGRASLSASPRFPEDGLGFEAHTPTGVLFLGVRAVSVPGRQARISLVPLRDRSDQVSDYANLRLDASNRTGAAFDIQFSDPRLDWGTHGPLPTEPLVSDHHFPDGLPTDWRRPQGPRDRALLAKSFASYVQDRFVREVLAPLPGYPGR